jgi:hypothetical protein
MRTSIVPEHLEKMKQLTEKLYQKANSDQFRRGMTWYKNCSDQLDILANRYKVDYKKVAAMFAALSPAVSVERNFFEVELLLICLTTNEDFKNFNFTTYGNNVQKAANIYFSKDEPDVFFNKISKTYNFYLNLTNYSNAVTIDRHILSALEFNTHYKALTPQRYKDLVGLFQDLSAKFKCKPRQLQAVVWVVYREQYLNYEPDYIQ